MLNTRLYYNIQREAVVYIGSRLVRRPVSKRGTKAAGRKECCYFCVHLLQYFVRTHIVYPTHILLCCVRCNFIEKRFNRIKKPINSAASAVVVIYVSTCRPMHLSGVFFFFFFFFSFLSHAHSNPGRDTTEAVKTENYRARDLSRSLSFLIVH